MLAQQQQDPITTGEILLAILPAAIAFVGVMGTLIFGIRQARVAWQQEKTDRLADRFNQAQLDRDRLLRTERIPLYRRLIETANEILWVSQQHVLAGDEEEPSEEEERLAAAGAWSGTLAEARFLAARPVVEVAVNIDTVRRARWWQANRMRQVRERGDEEGEERLAVDLHEMAEESDSLVLALVEACRRDIESLNPPPEPLTRTPSGPA